MTTSITPISDIARTRNLPPRRPQVYLPPSPEVQAMERYGNLAQRLYDALVPFVANYESDPGDMDDNGYIMLFIKLDDIIRAQYALKTDTHEKIDITV